MTRYSLTIQEAHYNQIKDHLIKDDGKERVIYLLCSENNIQSNPWSNDPEILFLSRAIVHVPEHEIIESSRAKISWSTESFVYALKKAEEENLIVGLIHCHPKGVEDFSIVDNTNEPELFKLAFNRNGLEGHHLSMIMFPDGRIIGRAWDHDIKKHKLKLIKVVGDRFQYFSSIDNFELADIFHRQELAFGKQFTKKLSRLKIGIVGCGATGSAVAMLLGRLGVGHLILFDKDTVEDTNLNRLHCSTMADIGRPKVEVIKERIEAYGFGTKIKPIRNWVDNEENHDLIKSCDIVFGCTDDHQGRLFLNRLAYFYLIPVIDIGLTIRLTEGENPEIQNLIGRMTVVLPGNACLLCHGVINVERAYAEGLARTDPAEYQRQKDEAYVIGEGIPNPAVVTFTTEMATVAVNEIIQRIQNYRKYPISNLNRYFNHGDDTAGDIEPRDRCRICHSSRYWGRGDYEPFLGRC